jgi:hypothetical protein
MVAIIGARLSALIYAPENQLLQMEEGKFKSHMKENSLQRKWHGF